MYAYLNRIGLLLVIAAAIFAGIMLTDYNAAHWRLARWWVGTTSEDVLAEASQARELGMAVGPRTSQVFDKVSRVESELLRQLDSMRWDLRAAQDANYRLERERDDLKRQLAQAQSELATAEADLVDSQKECASVREGYDLLKSAHASCEADTQVAVAEAKTKLLGELLKLAGKSTSTTTTAPVKVATAAMNSPQTAPQTPAVLPGNTVTNVTVNGGNAANQATVVQTAPTCGHTPVALPAPVAQSAHTSCCNCGAKSVQAVAQTTIWSKPQEVGYGSERRETSSLGQVRYDDPPRRDWKRIIREGLNLPALENGRLIPAPRPGGIDHRAAEDLMGSLERFQMELEKSVQTLCESTMRAQQATPKSGRSSFRKGVALPAPMGGGLGFERRRPRFGRD